MILRASAGALAAAVAAACAGSSGSGHDSAEPTFTRDVAPILYEHCASCHRPGESAPFHLLTYADTKRHAEQIVEVVQSRYMPPWLPADDGPPLEGVRRLSEDEILTLARWVASGAAEGDEQDLPGLPEWSEGWQLGEPDRIVEMQETFTVEAEGADVFRNFVIAAGVEATRWVEAVELRPGNKRVVHHAVLQIDPTPATRRLDGQAPGPGFPGMEMGESLAPDGHFIGWTPGKLPRHGIPGTAWRLDPGTDLVLQMHMLPSGRPEPLRPMIGLHFAERPPERRPSIVGLYIDDIDIPAGEREHVREDRFELPVAVDVLGVYPHAHYLGKEVRAWAELPGGGETALLRIPSWNFNWQDDYSYRTPVSLPAGSELVLRWVYDNSKDNVRNPSYPPVRVRSGNQSTDEMGRLALQVLTHDERDRAILAEAKAREALEALPQSWNEMNNLGNALLDQGRAEEALGYYRRALELQPALHDARYNLGIALDALGQTEAAVEELRRVVREDPDHGRAHNNLGHALLSQGRAEEALGLFRRAAELEPSLGLARYNLGNTLLALERHEEAADEFRAALALEPRHAMAHNNLGTIHHLAGRLEQAIAEYRAAIEIEPGNVEAHTNLGIALAASGRTYEAVAEWRRALDIDPGFALARTHLEQALRR